jgi:hypothetical protein
MRAKVRDESGAYAVLFGLLVVVLASIAALAVDLGNAMARKADVQAQADFAVLAGAQELTGGMTGTVPPAVVDAVRDYLNNNHPLNQDCAPDCVESPQLTNGDLSDGEVRFANGGLQVHTPFENVDYALAGVMGFDDIDVQGDATVGLFSPGPIVPFFLPKDCAAGTVVLKSSSYNPGAPTFDPPSTNGNTVAKINTLDQTTVPGAVPTTLTIYGEKFDNPSALQVDFFKEEGAVDFRFPVDTATGHPATLTIDTATDDEATTTLPPQVFNKPGEWYMRVNNGNGWSKDVGIFIVGDPNPPPEGCGQRSTGDFGVVDSPRTIGPPASTQLAEATALNMAVGIDHLIATWNTTPPAPAQDSCQGYAPAPVPDAILDEPPSTDGVNCLDVKNGMNTDTVTDGMITGVAGERGRLDTGSSTCDRNGGTAAKERLGKQTNDDVLSCFLPPGVTVGQVSGSSVSATVAGSISSDIFDSPRFMVVPVIEYPINPQNGFYPVVAMKPVFVTDEPYSSSNGSSYATSSNGVTISGTKVVQLTVVAIHEDALPDVANSNGDVVPYYGSGPMVIRLID